MQFRCAAGAIGGRRPGHIALIRAEIEAAPALA
jgi:hypothetical protein